MGASRKYCRDQFRWRMCFLEHESHTDFYQLCFQRSTSAVPKIVWSSFLFVGCLCTLIASLVLTVELDLMPIGYWFIYMTHWGLIANTLVTGCAVAVAWRCHLGKPIDVNFGLPWFIKLYWVLYNVAISLALFITVFYWTLLADTTTTTEDSSSSTDEATQTGFNFDNQILDVFIHGVNSALMALLLLTVKVPSRIAHLYHLIIFCLSYTLFTVIYYAAGGTDAFGNEWIYPVVDWSSPGTAMIVTLLSLVMLVLIYSAVVAIAAARDALSNRYCSRSKSIDLEI